MTSSDRYCTQLSYHTTDHEHDECFPLHPPQLAIEKYTYKDARAENFEVLDIFDTITLKMHEITYTTGDAILHGRRRTTRRWKARKRLKKYTREPALSARSSRRDARKDENSRFLLFFRNHRYCFPYFRVFRPGNHVSGKYPSVTHPKVDKTSCTTPAALSRHQRTSCCFRIVMCFMKDE